MKPCETWERLPGGASEAVERIYVQQAPSSRVLSQHGGSFSGLGARRVGQGLGRRGGEGVLGCPIWMQGRFPANSESFGFGAELIYQDGNCINQIRTQIRSSAEDQHTFRCL